MNTSATVAIPTDHWRAGRLNIQASSPLFESAGYPFNLEAKFSDSAQQNRRPGLRARSLVERDRRQLPDRGERGKV
jgi:hypothetical protein